MLHIYEMTTTVL